MITRLRSSALLFAFLLTMPTAFSVQAVESSPSGTIELAQYQVLELAPDAELTQEADGDAAGEPAVPLQDDSSDDAPIASTDAYPFAWIVTVSGDGLIISGTVPADAFKRFMMVRAGPLTTDETEIGEGAPDGFVLNALAALEIAARLEVGRVGYDGEQWFIESTQVSDLTLESVERVLIDAPTPASDWRIELDTAVANVGQSDSPPMPDVEQAETARDATAALATDLQIDEAAPASDMPIVVSSPEPPVDPAYTFSASKDADGTLLVTGHLPSAAARRNLLASADQAIRFQTVSVNPAAPKNFETAMLAGVQALSLLESGRVIFSDETWVLTGFAGIDTVRNGAVEVLNSAAPEIEWRIAVTARPAREVCEDEVTAYMADKAILFPSAGIVPTQQSLDVLPGLAERLAICPDAVVYVEGHTDSDGLASANLTLSIRRAEAVVDALIDLGISPRRLYAVGYGASLPVASNATAEGKRQNRRIVFNFEDIARPAP